MLDLKPKPKSSINLIQSSLVLIWVDPVIYLMFGPN